MLPIGWRTRHGPCFPAASHEYFFEIVPMRAMQNNYDAPLGNDPVRLRRELETRRRQYREMIENSVQGICVNAGGTPLFVNQTYADMLGYDSPQEILALGSLDPIVAPYHLEMVTTMRKARMNGEEVPTRYEFDAVRKNGQIITLEAIHSVIYWEGQRAIQHAIFDITELTRSQSNLFDPYFATNSQNGGLGLSSAFSIVKAHGGTITVHANPGRGTKLTVFLAAI